MSDLTFVVGDTSPSISGALTRSGAVLDLTTATSVFYQLINVLDNRLTVDGVADIVSPTAGTVRYDWAEGDLDIAGEYTSRWFVTFSDLTVQHTQPANTITVAPV